MEKKIIDIPTDVEKPENKIKSMWKKTRDAIVNVVDQNDDVVLSIDNREKAPLCKGSWQKSLIFD